MYVYKVIHAKIKWSVEAEKVLYRAWEKGLNIVLALKCKGATLLLFLLSSLFCTLSLFIRFALYLIFNGALGAKEMSVLWIQTHTHTHKYKKHKDTPGHKSASWKGQVHLKGLANGITGGAKLFCVPGLPKGFLTLTYPEDRLPRCNSLTWFLYTHYLWPIFVFYFLVLWLCLFVSFSQGYSNRGPFDDSCAPKRRKETTQV